MAIKLLLTVLGVLLAAFRLVGNREKASRNSPKKFDLGFYVKDNWMSHLLSALIAVTLILTYHYTTLDIVLAKMINVYLLDFISHAFSVNLTGFDLYDVLEKLLAFFCGFYPHKMLYGFDEGVRFLRPNTVVRKGVEYNRQLATTPDNPNGGE